MVASLGAIGIKGLLDDRTQARQAEEARVAAVSDQQRDAYTRLVRSAHFWHSAALEILAEFGGLPKDTAIDRSSILVQDLTQALALVELIGSSKARSAAWNIYERSMSVGRMYAGWLTQLAAAPKDALAPEFDSDAAMEGIDKLKDAITEFTDSVRTELGGAQQTSPASA